MQQPYVKASRVRHAYPPVSSNLLVMLLSAFLSGVGCGVVVPVDD